MKVESEVEYLKTGGYALVRQHLMVSWALYVAATREAVAALGLALFTASMPHANTITKQAEEASPNRDAN